jgi:rhodanese-related sulfurtransferase
MKQLLAAIFCFGSLISSSQFKADNVKYKTVFPEDLCKTLKDNPGFVLLDVRSDGEYNDTLSGSPALNIGHLQNALHINITQLPQRWKELAAYKDKPLFIYCSHSQRSRRASRLLADSGFTHIYNINGGLTNFYDQGIQSLPCDDYTVVSTVPYKIISAKQMANSKGSYYIVDLREDSAFNGKTDDERVRMQGRFADAVNIPFTKLPSNDLSLPSKPVLLVDDGGGQSPIAAKMLLDKGFKDVTILFNGMDGWVSYLTNSTDKPTIKWKSYSSYKMLSPDEFNKWMKENKSFTLIDVRPKDQFNSEAKNYIQNIGHIKGAVNIPYADLNTTTIPSTGAVVVYGFNSEDAVFNTARFLKGKGYSNLYVLQGGIWNLRWASHNLKNKEYLNEWVLNVPLENQ